MWGVGVEKDALEAEREVRKRKNWRSEEGRGRGRKRRGGRKSEKEQCWGREEGGGSVGGNTKGTEGLTPFTRCGSQYK